MDSTYNQQFKDIIKYSKVSISNIKPSDWVEQNVIMGKPFSGAFKYSRTPYSREIIDCFANQHPMKWIAIQKGAQIGLSAGVLIPIQLYYIKNDPCNIYFLVGSPDLIEKATEKLDIGITNAGLRPYIKPQVLRKKAQKSGDTNFKKEFSGGYIHIGSANNHKSIRDVSLKVGLFDDFESVKTNSKESGNTRKLLEQRFAAYADSHKIAYVSTPELKEGSNIEAAYLLGDQRKYLIPCQCCGEFIELVWSVTIGEITGGITWQLDENKKVISESVGYTCQMCGGFFNDKNKHELLNAGFWQPTATPSKMGYYSYHISSLYAPIGMYDWEHYVNDFVEANPEGQQRKEDLHKTFMNVCLGLTYEPQNSTLDGSKLQLNIRDYNIDIVPEEQSIKDGNGQIVLITCAADLGGRVAGLNSEYDDVRLDWEITAWSENGSEYKINQGSIGTFVPNENKKKDKEVDRKYFSYDLSKPNNVWREFDEILSKEYYTESGRKMTIAITGIDTGFAEHQVFTYIDRSNLKIVGLKGDKEHKYVQYGITVPNFKVSANRGNLYILKVGQMKDQISSRINLRWNKNSSDVQPAGFINFPQPQSGKYGLENYFLHYESEHRTVDKNNNFIWQKKSPTLQNHFFDVSIYNTALKEIITKEILTEVGIKKGSWADFVSIVLG